MRSSDVGAGCHRCHMGRKRDEHACGGGTCSRRIHVDDDWDFAGDDPLDDLSRRLHQSTRRVELDHQAVRLLGLGLVDNTVDKPFRDGRDRLILDLNEHDSARVGPRRSLCSRTHRHRKDAHSDCPTYRYAYRPDHARLRIMDDPLPPRSFTSYREECQAE